MSTIPAVLMFLAVLPMVLLMVLPMPLILGTAKANKESSKGAL